MRVLYIGGMTRSGTTLLERLLGELPGCCPVGESAQMWQMGIGHNERCGCGEQFHDCPLWSEVGAVAFGGWEKIDSEAMHAFRATIDRTKLIPGLALRMPPALVERADRYAEVYARLYHAIGQVTGAHTVVDASKLPALAFALRRRPDIDLRVVHAVRDSRGVAYSWSRAKHRPGSTGSATHLPTYSATKVALQWNTWNLAFGALRALGTPVQVTRYEDLVKDTRAAVGRIASSAGITDTDEAGLDHLSGDRAALPTTHGILGNPMRVQTGDIKVRLDDRWRQEMPARDRAMVTRITAPMLLAYRYRVAP